MKLEQAKRLYRTWRNHPDLINEEQVIPVIEAFIRLSQEIKELYMKEIAKCQKNTKSGR